MTRIARVAALAAVLAGAGGLALRAEDGSSAPALEAAAPRAGESAAPEGGEAAPEAAPRRFGVPPEQARIAIEATTMEAWVRVTDAQGKVIFMRIMKPREIYYAPDRAGLVLDTGAAKGLEVRVDGQPVAPLGAHGMIRRNIPLDPVALRDGTAQRVQAAAAVSPGEEALARAVAPAAEAKPQMVAAAFVPPPPAAAPAPLALPAAVAPSAAMRAPVTAAAPATPPGIVPADRSRILLEANKGTVVRLRQPAATVFVADPEVADIQVKSQGLVYLFGKRPGETVLFAADEQDRVILNTTVVVGHNLSRLRQALRTVAPDAAVEVDSVDGAIVLSGAVATASEAENIRRLAARFAPEEGGIINQLKVTAPNQINLRVRIAEVSRETLKNFGFNWDALISAGSFAFGIATGNPVVAGGQFLTRTGIQGANTNSTNNSIFGSVRTGSVDINGLIDALGTEGLITVLAEPNLTAMSGETASFLAGGEFPIPVPQNQNTITIEFKKFGVGLAFTPTLLEGDRINLRVRPEVSQLSSVGAVQILNFSIPALTTRRAETTVELGSGQSFAIAGLLQNNSTQDISNVPLLGDLPVLGALFRSDRFRRNETELVIIVTPYIVRPVSATRMAAPTDGLVAPNDVERIVGGMNYRQQLARRADVPRLRDGQSLIGPAGFVLD